MIRYYWDVSIFCENAFYGVGTYSDAVLEDCCESFRFRKFGGGCTISNFCYLSGTYYCFSGFTECKDDCFRYTNTYYEYYYFQDYYEYDLEYYF